MPAPPHHHKPIYSLHEATLVLSTALKQIPRYMAADRMAQSPLYTKCKAEKS